ncbi:MAG: hypothetical protein HKN68_10580 [Saprospiraceae bacterium]|nr:hypothetical protein [Saprospiraceae bacterium]
MKRNRTNTVYMIPLFRQTLRHDLYHIRRLYQVDMIEPELLDSLIELKESSINLLPEENEAVKDIVSTPPKSLIDADYYDALSQKTNSQFKLIKKILKCENARLEIIKRMMNDGMSSNLKDKIKMIFDNQRNYLSLLNNKAVRP